VKNKKRWLLLLIIIFPSFFWLILETSTINSKKLPHYGPKKVLAKSDTIFYQVPSAFYKITGDSLTGAKEELSVKKYPLFGIVFVSEKYRGDMYRLTGLWEYLNYKKDKVEHIPFIIVTPSQQNFSQQYEELKKLSQSKNIHFYTWPKESFDSITKIYFKEKPYYIDYSFFLLVDGKRNVRGYYDARYVAEMKRLIEEYKHLRLKEEKQLLINENEIKSEQ
jgi:hypothetical protein